jgi:hypothetical protein
MLCLNVIAQSPDLFKEGESPLFLLLTRLACERNISHNNRVIMAKLVTHDHIDVYYMPSKFG